MFKYTPKKSLIREMNVSKVGRWWDTQWIVVAKVMKRYQLTDSWMIRGILLDKYPQFCFYSEKHLSKVPIEGYLFPVAMFNEEKA